MGCSLFLFQVSWHSALNTRPIITERLAGTSVLLSNRFRTPHSFRDPDTLSPGGIFTHTYTPEIKQSWEESVSAKWEIRPQAGSGACYYKLWLRDMNFSMMQLSREAAFSSPLLNLLVRQWLMLWEQPCAAPVSSASFVPGSSAWTIKASKCVEDREKLTMPCQHQEPWWNFSLQLTLSWKRLYSSQQWHHNNHMTNKSVSNHSVTTLH